MLRTYTELACLETFEERFDYLALTGQVGTATFGFDRYLNQRFYTSTEWKKVRNFVLARDEACDLGIEGLDIRYMPLIHHMNPIQSRHPRARVSHHDNQEYPQRDTLRRPIEVDTTSC